MRLASFLVALGMLALPATNMEAQTCFGDASFAAGPMRLGAGLQSSDGAKSYGVNMAVGASAGAFASGGVARTKYDDIDGSGTAYGLTGGYAFDLNPARTMQVCPYAQFGHEAGPDIDAGLSILSTSVETLGVGGAVGRTVRVGPSLDLVPTVDAFYGVSRAWFTMDGVTDSQSIRFGEIEVGAGLVINKVLTLQPEVSIPVGVEGAKSSFGLAIAFSFGAPKP